MRLDSPLPPSYVWHETKRAGHDLPVETRDPSVNLPNLAQGNRVQTSEMHLQQDWAVGM